MIKDILAFTAGIVIAILVLDFVCFWCWIISGQLPVDNFYLGTITAHFISLII